MTTPTHPPYPYSPDVFTGDSPSVARLRLQIDRVAPHFRIATLVGESGTGKHAVARRIHRACPSASLLFNVIPLPGIATHPWDQQTAATCYLPCLDLIGLDSQSELLTLLQSLHRDTRLIFASRSDLKSMLSAGRLLPELYDRIGALTIRVPSLRQRTGDLEPMLARMLHRLSSGNALSSAVVTAVLQHPWPGNFVELWSYCERLAAALDSHTPALPGLEPTPALTAPVRLEDVLQRHVFEVLESCAGNKLRAAELLGISRSTLYRMLNTAPSAAAVR